MWDRASSYFVINLEEILLLVVTDSNKFSGILKLLGFEGLTASLEVCVTLMPTSSLDMQSTLFRQMRIGCLSHLFFLDLFKIMLNDVFPLLVTGHLQC